MLQSIDKDLSDGVKPASTLKFLKELKCYNEAKFRKVNLRAGVETSIRKLEARHGITPNTVSIRFGCKIEEEIYRSPSRGRLTLGHYKTWRETFTVPDEGYKEINLTCPICHSSFVVRVYNTSKARLRKLYFDSCFIAIASGALVLGVFAPTGKGFLGYYLAAPFICFAVWQLLSVIRGRFDASDVVSQVRGKVHRIFDEHKIIFPK